MLEFGLYGAFAALTVSAALETTWALPSVRSGVVRLGFLGRIIVGAGIAAAVDHHFLSAYLSSVAGLVLLQLARRASPELFEMRGGNISVDEQTNQEWNRLQTVRRKLGVVEDNIAVFEAGQVPPHLILQRDECRKEIRELEDRYGWASRDA